ncbi:hypothetical protein Lepto782_22330 (plasmid) [Leptospira interrogans serovar Canicola]|uniref:Uncharacterized protein n=2 Tax=Leptospira interrogans TaxID=173 RepID=A0AAQ0B190_LEPIR|nr:hypothetical protein LEP1GSC037_0375 [Leptospira interrogans str. 2006001854]QOI44949.1 hypothetical protein Lepto782_22330 [Leptospira interrogans serovar Canicola]
MTKKLIHYILFFACIGTFESGLFASELLFKSGEAFLIEEVNESADVVNVRWKGRQFRIPKSEIQRIDYSKKGPESSYNYSEFRLTDGSQVRGIIVETKKDKLVFRTELGFVEIEKSKIQNLFVLFLISLVQSSIGKVFYSLQNSFPDQSFVIRFF